MWIIRPKKAIVANFDMRGDDRKREVNRAINGIGLCIACRLIPILKLRGSRHTQSINST